jgi:hypothetical protein
MVGVGGGKGSEIDNTSDSRMELLDGDLQLEWEQDGEEYINLRMTMPD